MYRFLALIFFCIFLVGISYAQAQEDIAPAAKQEMKMNDDLTRRGMELRAEIDKTYQELSAAKGLNSAHGNDITDIVTKYIPVGTSFDDAENILRAASFKVGPRPNTDTPNDGRTDRYDVVASLNPYVTHFLESKTSVYINLSPSTPGDYSKVRMVSGAIVIAYL